MGERDPNLKWNAIAAVGAAVGGAAAMLGIFWSNHPTVVVVQQPASVQQAADKPASTTSKTTATPESTPTSAPTEQAVEADPSTAAAPAPETVEVSQPTATGDVEIQFGIDSGAFTAHPTGSEEAAAAAAEAPTPKKKIDFSREPTGQQ